MTTALAATKLTDNQAAAVHVLGAHSGKTVEVLTSGYTANVAAKAIENSVGTFTSTALRGLAAKGFIRIEAAYWKGARITVLATTADCEAAVQAHYDRAAA